MSTGWVYVLSNPLIPNIVKVGVTSGLPEERAKQLDTTGVPESFTVETAFLFANGATAIEQKTHQLLNSCRRRNNREFFECSPEYAAEKILFAAETQKEAVLKTQPVLLTENDKIQIKLRKIKELERLEKVHVAEEHSRKIQEILVAKKRDEELEARKRERLTQRQKSKEDTHAKMAIFFAICTVICLIFSFNSFDTATAISKGKLNLGGAYAPKKSSSELNRDGSYWLVGAAVFGVAFGTLLHKSK